MGTWKCQAKNCQNGISDFTQKRMEYARKRSGAGSGIPNDILCQECYGKLLLGPSITMKDGSTKSPSAQQIELGKIPRESGATSREARKPYASDANANQTDTSLTDMSFPVPEESKNKRRKRQKAENAAERAANGGMTKKEMAAMHTFMCKMSDMKPPDANEIESANQTKEMQNDYTTGLAALTEWSRTYIRVYYVYTNAGLETYPYTPRLVRVKHHHTIRAW
jgi:hypothetical protein